MAYDREYITRDDFGRLFQEATEIRKMMVSFLKNMVMGGSGVKNIRKPRDFSEEIWQRYEQITGQPRPELFRKRSEDQ